MSNDVTVVCSFGNPGQEESAVFSPLDRGDCIDIGIIIEEIIDKPELPGLPDLPNAYYVVYNGIPVIHGDKYVIFDKRIIDGK